VSQAARKATQIVNYVLNAPSNNKRPKRRQCGSLHVVAATDGEHESTPAQSVGIVGAQNNIRGGVVGIRVHCVGAVELA